MSSYTANPLFLGHSSDKLITEAYIEALCYHAGKKKKSSAIALQRDSILLKLDTYLVMT